MKNYETRDLYLACALIASGMELTGITRRPNEKRRVFIFDDTPSRPDLVKAYWNWQGEVSPRKLFEALRSLRDQMWAESVS